MEGTAGTMTLAFELSALQALANPQAVFMDARQWSQYVGVVSDEPTYVITNYTRKQRIRQDFFSGPQGKADSLDRLKAQFETDRHVFIGTTDDDREIAEENTWEFLPVEQAAEAAGWDLLDTQDTTPDATGEDQHDTWP